MKQGSPSAGYHRRLLSPEILRDMMHAAFQMRPYRDQNRQSGRRSNTTNAGVKYAPHAPDRPVAQEDLGFHPALAYKYSGERGACKVGSCIMSSGVGIPLIGDLESGGHLQVKRFDSLCFRSLSLRPFHLSRGFPSRSILYYGSVGWKWH